MGKDIELAILFADVVGSTRLYELMGDLRARDMVAICIDVMRSATEQRQGTVIARNVAASLGVGTPTTYRHRDLGLVADLGGTKAVARPFGLPLTGLPAKVVTKGYHLGAIPYRANKLRVAADWLVNLVSRPTATQLGLVQESAAQLRSESSDELSRPAGATAMASAQIRPSRSPDTSTSATTRQAPTQSQHSTQRADVDE